MVNLSKFAFNYKISSSVILLRVTPSNLNLTIYIYIERERERVKFKQLIDDIAINIWSPWKFASMENIRR